MLEVIIVIVLFTNKIFYKIIKNIDHLLIIIKIIIYIKIFKNFKVIVI